MRHGEEARFLPHIPAVSAMNNVKIDINFNLLAEKIRSRGAQAQIELSRQALADCNRLCRVNTGRLRASSAASRLADGELVWSAPYARRVYYTGVPQTAVNPNASLMWAHKAAAANREKWRKLAAGKMKWS